MNKITVLFFYLVSSMLLLLPPSSWATMLEPVHTRSVIYQPLPDEPPIPMEDIQRFATAIAQIKHHYIKKTSYQHLFDNAIRGMLMELDPHSSFLDRKQLDALETSAQGEFAGLGIEVFPDNGLIRIISPIDDTPAKKAGIQAGDLIIKINGKLVKKLSTDQAIQAMRGKKGSKVTLTLVRKKHPTPITVTMTRDIIKLHTVKHRLLENGYGYIRLTFFHHSTAAHLRQAIQHLNKKNHLPLNGLILDLRNNPGGLLTSATEVADCFIDGPKKQYQGRLVYTKGRAPFAELQSQATPGDLLQGKSLVVLIDEGSASAAEVVAGALQDYQRAVIIGTRSFGKGSVQTVLPITSETAIKLTTALYYTPKGRSIQATGIRPDITIPQLKLNKAVLQDDYLIQEADLSGHLQSSHPSDNKEKTKATVSILQQAKEDFQLLVALSVLKGMSAKPING